MRISKILNNNAAVVRDDTEQEKIVMGRGICFKKRPGEEIEEAAVDKVFSLSAGDVSSKFQRLVQDMPMEHMVIGEEIIAEAKRKLGRDLNDMVYISLIDHAIPRRSDCKECPFVGYPQVLPGGIPDRPVGIETD